MSTERSEQVCNWEQIAPTGQLLRPAEVVDRTGLSRSQIYQMISEGRFPPFIKLSARAAALPENWLNAFVELRAEAALRKIGPARPD